MATRQHFRPQLFLQAQRARCLRTRSLVVAVVDIIRRHRWWIGLGVCIGLAMAVLSLSVAPQVYSSTVILKVEGLCSHGCAPVCDKCGTAPLPTGSGF